MFPISIQVSARLLFFFLLAREVIAVPLTYTHDLQLMKKKRGIYIHQMSLHNIEQSIAFDTEKIRIE